MIYTRCPSCETVFRATEEQLEARRGRVRCGECGSAFDASDSALQPLSDALEPAQPAAREEQAETEIATAPAADDDAAAAESQPAALQATDDASDDATVTAAEEASSADRAMPGVTESPPTDPLAQAEPERAMPSFLAPKAPATDAERRQRMAWAAGVGITLLLLGVQTALAFRNELALAYPGLKPTLSAWCVPFGCELRPPSAVEWVGIEASALQPHPTRGGLLSLTATIKNRATFAQGYPYLELTLTDTRDQPLARRVFAPADYLPDVGGEFAANAELAVDLTLDAHEVEASGYRVEVFFP